MKLRTKAGAIDGYSSAYETGEKHGLFWSTNGWQFDPDYPGNYCEMEVGDDYYILDVSQQKNKHNFNGVRLYPTGGLGSFGARYEHNGMKTKGLIPKLPGTRGQGYMKTDVFDMTEVAKLTQGIPCFMSKLPQIDIHVKSEVLSGDLIANSFLDLYLNDVSNPRLSGDYTNTINGISYNGTKAWNINFWFKLPHVDNPGTQPSNDGGWSGAKVFHEFTLNGVELTVGYKRETAGLENDFNLMAVIPKNRQTIEHLDVTALLEYMYTQDWIQLIKAAGMTPREDFGNPSKDHVLCGIHGPGNEVWMGKGRIKYTQYSITVDGKKFGFGGPKLTTEEDMNDTSNITVNVEPDEPAPEENNKAKSDTDSKKKSEAICSCDDVSVGDDRTVPIKVGVEKALTVTSDYKKGGEWKFDPPGLAKVSGTWKQLSVVAEPKGSGETTVLHYQSVDGDKTVTLNIE